MHQGVHADAIRFYKQALAIDREVRNVSNEANDLCNLGIVCAASGDIAAANEYYRQSLSLAQEANDQRGIATIIETVATFLVEHSPNSLEPACRFLGAAEKLRDNTGSPRSSGEQDIYDRTVPKLHQSLSDRAFAEAWAQGRTMTPVEAINDAIQETEALQVAVVSSESEIA